jgi:hypothetical protein
VQFYATQEKTLEEEARHFFLIPQRVSIPKKRREAQSNRQKIDN